MRASPVHQSTFALVDAEQDPTARAQIEAQNLPQVKRVTFAFLGRAGGLVVTPAKSNVTSSAGGGSAGEGDAASGGASSGGASDIVRNVVVLTTTLIFCFAFVAALAGGFLYVQMLEKRR